MDLAAPCLRAHTLRLTESFSCDPPLPASREFRSSTEAAAVRQHEGGAGVKLCSWIESLLEYRDPRSTPSFGARSLGEFRPCKRSSELSRGLMRASARRAPAASWVMGRLISDGAFYWYIVDVVVRPERQSKGLGTAIMTELEAVVSECSTTGVANLVAGPEVQPFYARLGYEGSGSQFMGKAVRP